jgi:hypothetical protein
MLRIARTCEVHARPSSMAFVPSNDRTGRGELTFLAAGLSSRKLVADNPETDRT